MGIFPYVYAEIRSRAILEKNFENSLIRDPRMKSESPINITHHIEEDFQVWRPKVKVKWQICYWLQWIHRWLVNRVKIEPESDSDWISFSILLINSATGIQFRWFKILRKIIESDTTLMLTIVSSSIVWWVVFSNYCEMVTLQFRINFDTELKLDLEFSLYPLLE